MIIVFVLFSIIISNMDAYRLDNDRVPMNNLDENNHLNDPYFIPRLEKLLAEVEAANGGSDNKDSSSSDHIIHTPSY